MSEINAATRVVILKVFLRNDAFPYSIAGSQDAAWVLSKGNVYEVSAAKRKVIRTVSGGQIPLPHPGRSGHVWITDRPVGHGSRCEFERVVDASHTRRPVPIRSGL